MVSDHKKIGRSRAALADRTNTPPISRPRRTCGAYASPFINAQFTFKRPADPGNRLSSVEDAVTSVGHLRENNGSAHNFSTPREVLPAMSSRLLEDNGEEGFSDFRVYSKRGQTKGRVLETLSLSCPPLRRPSSESSAVERSHRFRNQGADIRKRHPIDTSTDLPESERPKKVQRRRNSMPANGGRYSFPEMFVCEQQAHFAEVDAFVLQEEEQSDDSSV